ncbi:MAG: hypothetical protein RL309_1362 [Verrucomicrobiota bacterium]
MGFGCLRNLCRVGAFAAASDGAELDDDEDVGVGGEDLFQLSPVAFNHSEVGSARLAVVELVGEAQLQFAACATEGI